MQSKAATPEQYLAELPDDRRAELEKVRAVVLANLDRDYEEGMSYGMISYCVPHRVHPAGYHCDPKQALPFAALAAQKNYGSLYLMGLYAGQFPGSPARALYEWFIDAWKKSGKKLDMGKSCIRFKKAEDLALDVIGEAIRRMPARKYVEVCEAGLAARGKKPAAKRATSAKRTSDAKRAKPARAKK